jgi:cytoskeletal protein RodZ
MFDIGSSLREARGRRGLSPTDVHKAIRIRERYLTALEDERWELLPGDAYTKGFLRTYAEFLGLDGQLYVDEFNARFAAHEDEPFAPEPLGGRRGATGILFRTVGAAVVVAAIVGGAAARRGAGHVSRPTLDAAPALAAAKPAVRKHEPTRTKTKPAVSPKPTATTISAVRDVSWLSVRIGGANGREIFRGYLLRGRTLTLGLAHPIWVRLGRPLALDVRIGTRLVRNLPQAPTNLLLTKDGASR